jgi:hypothetical protein
VIGQRSSRTTPAQQLFLLNDPFVMGRALATARRVLAQGSADDSAKISDLYRILFSREPTAAERERSMKYLTELRQTYDAPTSAVSAKDPASEAGATIDRPTGPREAAWADLCHALLASGEFLYVE